MNFAWTNWLKTSQVSGSSRKRRSRRLLTHTIKKPGKSRLFTKEEEINQNRFGRKVINQFLKTTQKEHKRHAETVRHLAKLVFLHIDWLHWNKQKHSESIIYVGADPIRPEEGKLSILLCVVWKVNSLPFCYPLRKHFANLPVETKVWFASGIKFAISLTDVRVFCVRNGKRCEWQKLSNG